MQPENNNHLFRHNGALNLILSLVMGLMVTFGNEPIRYNPANKHIEYSTNKGSSTYKSLSAEKFAKLIEGNVQILDARTGEEYAEGHIEGAVLADVKIDNFREAAEAKLSKDAPVAVYCRSGKRSLTACDILSGDGYKVYNLKTGIIGWTDAGLPVVKDEPVRPKPMCGAYTQQRDLTQEDINLFRNTLKDNRYTPISVATQVVAGINYRFFCKGPDGDVVVTIYKPLHDAPRVTQMSK